jgi:hypothetical protein
MTTTWTTTAVDLARFPLIPRSRPRALTLEQRVRDLAEIPAQTPGPDRARQAVRAAEVFNKAALLASDTGMHDLARKLCWEQWEIYQPHRPLPAWARTLALQPLLNIPRQLIREGDGAGALAVLGSLHSAAQTRCNVLVLGRLISLNPLTRASDDEREVTLAVWSAMLADGTRALALQGRWRQAADYASEHRGVGQRLLDGRQTAVLALIAEREPQRALILVEASRITESWDTCIQALLRTLCLHAAGLGATRQLQATISAVLEQISSADPSLAVFCTRLGVTTLELAHAIGATDHTDALQRALRALAKSDAYAAHDLLAAAVPQPRDLCLELAALAHAAGIGTGTIPERLQSQIRDAVMHATKVLDETLAHEPGIRPTPLPTRNTEGQP